MRSLSLFIPFFFCSFLILIFNENKAYTQIHDTLHYPPSGNKEESVPPLPLPDKNIPAYSPTYVSTPADSSTRESHNKRWTPQIHLSTQYHLREKTPHGNISGSIMLPIKQNSTGITMFDLAGELEHNIKDIHIGGIFREMNGPHHWGMYAYYNAMQSPYDNLFHYLIFGFEYSNHLINFRSNVYTPMSSKKAVPQTATETIPTLQQHYNYLLSSDSISEYMFSGIKAELGVAFPLKGNDTLEVSPGVFHMTNSHTYALTGATLKAEWIKRDIIWKQSTFKAKIAVQYDKHRQFEGNIGVSLSIPLIAGEMLTKQESRLIDSVWIGTK